MYLILCILSFKEGLGLVYVKKNLYLFMASIYKNFTSKIICLILSICFVYSLLSFGPLHVLVHSMFAKQLKIFIISFLCKTFIFLYFQTFIIAVFKIKM